MPPLPPRWHRTLNHATDILEFEKHLAQILALPVSDQEFPGKVLLQGDAYHLMRVVYKAMERGLVRSLFSALLGNPFVSMAAQLGKVFLDHWIKDGGTVEDSIKYIHSVYLVFEKDNGSSATIIYADAMALNNPYWEPRTTY